MYLNPTLCLSMPVKNQASASLNLCLAEFSPHRHLIPNQLRSRFARCICRMFVLPRHCTLQGHTSVLHNPQTGEKNNERKNVSAHKVNNGIPPNHAAR